MDITDISKINWNAILFPPDQGLYLFIKIFCILFSAGAVAFIIYVLVTKPYLQKVFLYDWVEFFKYNTYTFKPIGNDWNKIVRRVKTNIETEYKLAVIEADLLLNDVLSRLGYEGKTMDVRLGRVTKGTFSSIESILAADQVYQKLVQGEDYKLDYEETKRLVNIFRQALTELDAF